MSSVKTVDLADFAKTLGVYTDNSIRDLRNAAARGIQQSIPDLVKASPVDTGLYAASWNMTVEEQAIILGNYAPYAGIIEYGARPFTPPIGPLLAWAKRVTQSGSQPPDYDSHVWALAKAVQKKIAAEGMQPRHIMQNTIPTILENIKREMQALA